MKTESNNDELQELFQRVLTLQRERFYGSVELKFQEGALVLILEHRSYKPHELCVRPVNRKVNDETIPQR